MAALIKLRQKPRKPKRKKIIIEIEVGDGDSLVNVLRNLGNPDPSNVTFSVDWHWEDKQTNAVYCRMETDQEFQEVLDSFVKRRKKYDDWYFANETLILKEIQRRKDEAAAREKVANEKARKKLLKELAKLEKETG